ncbi:hypothetical protein B0I73DRAFT_132031 [Yarrowia lipolytica]|jgi:hypothetical protein|uniref:YALI0C15268p n=2 Tax=Yarrowia lipolytica TaxID=4952 RepID=Q6CBV1_YARLI|nr:YALI0C15268p [Yarrowia lipolytica CLIB122]AOW02913.1 hypothetical protein YALI1_C21578g [Yarrowia lipolytica]KAB8280425.1 hypothetical protein BKA91DRAFT_141937 [Yarrowia lipolytica]KAE8169514.1 hypothetical protein BKA90DRAFT_142470 [Yarrowia lipolytica]KAJ8053481.1 hypothetical protein LXG23DRAFT_49713 [Yarrowia lipolytica]QNP95851.1 Hypothetical protein YALI2_B00156g [Yarrowia lipolytica]|eukprot:XP_501861.1 YALI0C15268p [Yarrowia lipolytica CLIB122]
MISRNLILTVLVSTALASLCVDHQKSGDQVLLAVQPCENATSITPSDTESALSIFIRSASGEPEADLAETLKAKLDSGDLAGYLSLKRDFERDQADESAESAQSFQNIAIDTHVTIHTTQNYTLQSPAHLQKRGGCSMYWPGDVGLEPMDIHYYNDFFYPQTSSVNWVCLGECTDYIDHMWADGTLSGSFYYTYNDCKFRSQNGWNGRTQNKCRAGAFYRLTQDASHVVQGTNPGNTIYQVSGSIPGKDHWSPRICMSSSNSCSSGTGSDGRSYC